MKLNAPAPAAPASAPAEPISEPADDAGFGGFGDEEKEPKPSSDKPFDDEPFDAGVEADEDTDPKKFIEQLTGKLGQSLRKYNEEQGKPDFELEKFVVNSVLSATHTAEMDDEDRKDIIKKVNTAGDGEKDNEDNDSDSKDDSNDDFGGSDESGDDFGGNDFGGEEEDLQELSIYESEMGNLFLDKPKKNDMFQEGSNDILDEDGGCWTGYKRKAGTEKFAKGSCVKIEENHETIEGGESLNYMFWQNLKTIHHASGELLEMNQQQIDDMCANGHAWAVDHISTSSDDIEEVYHFFEANIDETENEYDGETEGGYEDDYGSVENINLSEAEYHDKTVKLGKPSKGDVKKFKVYVKNKKGNVVKVNFGDPNMEIKRDNPERRKSFRARHKCSQAKDRTTPKYWSCKMWSSTPVSKIVGENLVVNENNSIFDKNYLKNRINETFNQEENMQELMMEPQVMPKPSEVQPNPSKVQPNIDPSRKNKPFLPNIDPSVKPDPKAKL